MIKKTRKPEKLYVPDPEGMKLLEDAAYLQKTVGVNRHALRYAKVVLSLIYLSDEVKDRPGWVEIRCRKFTEICKSPTTWNGLKKALKAAGLIDSNGSWDDGKTTGKPRAEQYRLGPMLKNCEWVCENAPIVPVIKPPPQNGTYLDSEMAFKALEVLDLSEDAKGRKRNLLEQRRAKARIALKIERFTNRVKIGPKTGRASSSLTRLCFEIRNCYKIANKPTAEADLKNSQPLLMATLYLLDCPEKQEWIKLATGKGIYKALAEETGRTEKEVKFWMVEWIGGHKGRRMIDRWLIKAGFTQLQAICSEIKKADSKGLSHKLQRLESDVIVQAFRARWTGHCMTVHDSVRVEADRLEEAQALIIQIFEEEYGITPRVEQKL